MDAARRRGRRRLRARRAALPVLAVVALAAALTVPGGLLSAHPERTVASPRPPASSSAVNAPWQFNPLIPYASFGWLPPGYSESLANGIDVNQGVTSATDFMSREAAAPAAGRLLYLQVNARDMCATTVADLRANIRAHGQMQVACIDAAFTVTGAAQDVNGRPAFWTDHGSGVAWEYAPDAWAELSLSGIVADGGKALPPTAATRALLQKVAAAPAVCHSSGSQSSYVNRLGVQWLYIVNNLRGDGWQRLCATAPVDGLTGVDITMDMTNPASGAPLPGSAQLGGTLGALSRLLLLGPRPAAWIANPVN